MRPRRLAALLVLASWAGVVTTSASGCLVLGLNRFTDDKTVEADDRLVGQWIDTDDNLTLTIERSDWRSYRVSYAHAIATGQATAYLFRAGDAQFIDLMPVRGVDPGVFTFAGHALARVSRLDAQALTIAPLSYDWFKRRLESGEAPRELAIVGSERDLLLATASMDQMQQWLRARAADDAAFGTPVEFHRAPNVN